MSSQPNEPDPILARVGQALGFTGSGEAAAKVGEALDRAGVSQKDVLLFIPIFLAFYADTRDLDLTQFVLNIKAEAERTLKAVRRLRYELLESYRKTSGDTRPS